VLLVCRFEIPVCAGQESLCAGAVGASVESAVEFRVDAEEFDEGTRNAMN